jgi:hypothetical protein
MKQYTANNFSKIKRDNFKKTNGKYSKIIEALRYYNVIRENSSEKVTVKFNDGGIIYIEVEDKKILK